MQHTPCHTSTAQHKQHMASQHSNRHALPPRAVLRCVQDLLHDLYDIPARSCDRKVNEFVKRVRAAKIHFLIMGQLRKQMPYFGEILGGAG